ncbi:MAG: hypothetical protein NVSMB17_10480 [Candidatus Dormibacteria bacterium]
MGPRQGGDGIQLDATEFLEQAGDVAAPGPDQRLAAQGEPAGLLRTDLVDNPAGGT